MPWHLIAPRIARHRRFVGHACPVGYDVTGLLEAHLGVDLTSIPAINVNTAQTIYAEVGPDLSAFRSGRHFASWLCLNPDNKITGGRIMSAQTRACSNRLRKALQMAGQGLQRADNELGQFARRMKAKLGAAAAVTAVAHKLARIIYAVLTTRKAYDGQLHRVSAQRRVARTLDQLKKRAKTLGFELTAIKQPEECY